MIETYLTVLLASDLDKGSFCISLVNRDDNTDEAEEVLEADDAMKSEIEPGGQSKTLVE